MEATFVTLVLIVIAFAAGRASKRWRWAAPADVSLSTRALEQSAPDQDAEQKIPMNGERLFALVFISAWLVGWSTAIVFVSGAFLANFTNGLASVFIGAWLVAALAGWGMAVRTIYKLITGQPVYSRGRTL